MDAISIIAEDKIKRAIKEGEFKHLPGKGKPLEFEDLSALPEDLRIGYKLLKNAGIITDEKQLNKEILNLRDLISACDNEEDKAVYERKLNEKTVRLQKLIDEKQLEHTATYRKYEHKINQKLYK
ncbi:hypothetical protein JOD43_000921 [Pullulanibacillus pueri]|uniref:DUF1992 domain-containing protein n=1 Tax=Pullulanibacillus pueri TaxID=1437324 RepID=A0A8J3EL69_9BACL|nr:DUF1992 domain-containing protein [Pullulanibacillus pueri]MBM7680757.1 hypothetical protein [Pullulanibacillus pueri]GGH78219.1 DUF1992 domain-containing protein [Pullulanibacillus pueri]